ncbi:MAG TPA: hypothetical protein VGM05_29840 [Planctomycetaceae bacterium]
MLITKDGEPLATLTRSRPKQWPCKAGSAKEASYWMAPDFDAPLEEFREYTAEPSAASHDEPEARITRVSRQSNQAFFTAKALRAQRQTKDGPWRTVFAALRAFAVEILFLGRKNLCAAQ